MGKKSSEQMKESFAFKTSTANSFDQRLHEKVLMDFSPTMLKSEKTISLEYTLIAKGTSCKD